MLIIERLNLQHKKQAVLKDISLTLQSAKVYGLMGPNGAGKTSLIKQICGIRAVQRGKIWINGCEITSMGPRERSRLVAYIPQRHMLSFGYSVYEVVAMGCHPHGAELPFLIEKVLKETGLWRKKNCSILELSGGEQQRVFLARAFVQNTPFLVMDEPFTFLDPRQQLNMARNLQHYKEKGHTLLVSLHDVGLAKMACDELIMLKDGQIFQMGKTCDLICDAMIEKLYA